MTSRNDITGDKIQSKLSSKQFEENFEKYFGKRKTNGGYVPPKETKAEQEEWDEKRMDIVGQNGPTGAHYEETK